MFGLLYNLNKARVYNTVVEKGPARMIIKYLTSKMHWFSSLLRERFCQGSDILLQMGI